MDESSESRLRMLGERYMANPDAADDLLVELMQRERPERHIRQEWLNCHWDNDDAVSFMAGMADIYGFYPEPIEEFLHTCWERNCAEWHSFILLADVETNDLLARQIYARFELEGPSDEVIDSMLFLRVSPLTDRYASVVMPSILNRGMRDNRCCTGLLKLWRRYAVSRDLDDSTLAALMELLDVQDMAHDAVRAAECLTMGKLKDRLEPVAKLAARNWDAASGTARRIIRGLSDSVYVRWVADAVSRHPWHPYLDSAHTRLLWRLVDHMRNQRAVKALTYLYNFHTPVAVAKGVFTALMEIKLDYHERARLYNYDADDFPVNVHAAVIYMYMRGQPPPTGFHEALQKHPEAVRYIARRAPLVRKEVCWARRKTLLCAMAEWAAKDAVRPCCREPVGVLKRLARSEAAWPMVLAYV